MTGSEPPADDNSFLGIMRRLARIQQENAELGITGRMFGVPQQQIAPVKPVTPEEMNAAIGDSYFDSPELRKFQKAHPFHYILGFTLGIGTVVGQIISIALRPLFQSIEEKTTTNIPTLADLLNLDTNNVGTPRPEDVAGLRYAELAKKWGLPREWYERLYMANGQIPAVGQLLDLLNRQDGGAIRGEKKYTEEYVKNALRESALKDRYIDDLMELRFQLLGASDYIRFGARDAFDDEVAQRDGTDEGAPKEVPELLKALGYRPEDARLAWRAHWELPSPTQVFEMMHRGELKPGEVDEYLKQADYSPRWRPLMKAISYNPITRTDAKRAYKLGLGGFDDARLKKAYTDLGYNDSDASLLVEFTRLDVGEEARQEKELLIGPVRAKALQMYQTRRISEGELRQVLANLKYPTELVDRYIADVQFQRTADFREEIATALKGAYVKNLRSADDTRAMLVEHGWDVAGANELLEVWGILRQTTELSPVQSATRDLTKAEILAAYTDDLWDEQTTRQKLADLGYDGPEVDAIFGHAQLQKVKKEKADAIEVIHQEVVAGGRDFSSASVELDRLGVTATQKRGYLIRWGQERQKRIPDFPVALLEKLAAQKLLTADTATFYLQNQGYTPDQIMLLLRLWDITAAEKAAKKAVSPAGGSPAKLNRRDYENLYLGDRNRRQEAFLGLRAIGYSESAATFILDAIDRTRI